MTITLRSGRPHVRMPLHPDGAQLCQRSARALGAVADALGVSRYAALCAQIEALAPAGGWEELEQQLVPALHYEHQVVVSVLFESGR